MIAPFFGELAAIPGRRAAAGRVRPARLADVCRHWTGYINDRAAADGQLSGARLQAIWSIRVP
jgi:hypothetical protein